MIKTETKEKLEAMAVEFGLPAWWLNFAGGWLLGCNACTTAGHIVKLYAAGKITKEQHQKLFSAVANAKEQGDRAALLKLRGQLEGLRTVRFK